MNSYLIEQMPWGRISVAFNKYKQITYASLTGEVPEGAVTGEWPELSEKLQAYGRGQEVNFFEMLKADHFPQFTRQVMIWLQHNCQWGQVTTYGKVAKAIGRPKSSRAVGQVMRRNQLPLFVP